MVSHKKKGKLPRLPAECYRGNAYVFWTYTTEGREKIPLSAKLHLKFREIMLHACLRYHLAVPVYCMMPDHIHFFWIGLSEGSDQSRASPFLRKYLAPFILPARWQRQAHDHVVREHERTSGCYADTVNYILKNPIRAGLVQRWKDYPYLGAMLPGYPDLDRRNDHFNELFWRLVENESEV